MSEAKKADEPKGDNTDQELSDLLNSALDDFTDKEVDKPAAKTDEKKQETTEAAETGEGEEVEWSEDFLRQATQQFQNDIARLCGDIDPNVALSPEQIQQSFQKMAEAAQQVLQNPGEPVDSTTDFSSAITQTLRGLSEGTENLQNPFSEADLMNMFAGGAMGGGMGGLPGAGGENGFVPFMQGMMQSLLSKEVLYPSLKDILEKYPDWLQANAATLPQEERQRYENQKRLMEDVCKELEEETDADSADVKRERFEKVLSLMQKLQDYGQPPTDLVGEVGPALQFDPQGNPNPEQCSVM